jgi:hypothetical protein
VKKDEGERGKIARKADRQHRTSVKCHNHSHSAWTLLPWSRAKYGASRSERLVAMRSDMMGDVKRGRRAVGDTNAVGLL